ncbi:CRS1 / YhbY (CRM) domain-containing protein [Striga asiatica]|uniref:CRS1 / YhbY (CRM) domain-containing protein n=1 Tax=Striga asiatica TaxID=4170 RepID=A0A5A7PA87_STRAF|nr:CRS1 / YhbY (CRM) domain-containing protein [Striga asiatica]
MLVPLCSCNRHFSFTTSKTLLNPAPQIPGCHYPHITLKPLRRRVSISAAAEPAAVSRTHGKSAFRRIAEKLRSLGYVEEIKDDAPDEALNPGSNSPGEIFVPLPNRLPKYRVGHTLDTSWSTPENPVPEPGSGTAIQRYHELRRGVVEERIRARSEEKRNRAPSLAELTLPEEELRRLRTVGIALKKKLKVGKAGITEGIVNGIHERWRRTELVKITCEDICRMNMKRTHLLLERKTGGLVVWRSGSNIVLYRGSDYKYPYFFTNNSSNESSSEESSDLDEDHRTLNEVLQPQDPNAVGPGKQSSHPPLIKGVGLPNRVRFQLPGEAQLADEADALLEGLGPRFTDWWSYDPLPVDADLLPAVVPGYKRPLRLLPYGVKPKLTNDEMTTLKRLGRPLPCHFALGRNRKLQGLAASIVKLWEKCEIAKIAIKRGVQNTRSELMAEELKCLTGGTLLSRDKDFIVIYRGKDFLPASASSAIEERRKNGIYASKDPLVNNSSVMNQEEGEHEINQSADEAENEEESGQNLQSRSERRRLRFSVAAVEKTKAKLSIALEKKAKAEKILAELEKSQITQPLETDKEGITEEERYMLRKVGLRMKAFLLLGRRGVFDGTVENMHLHWKYRELVKVCIGWRNIEEVHGIAQTLEAESGGILVAIERVNKGFAIIIYRGKNYKRPASLRPRTLLSKREAMKRSLEAQRRESLKLNVLKLSRNINELKLKMEKEEDKRNLQLTEDLKHGTVNKEAIENHHNDDKMSSRDSGCDHQSYYGDLANETSESHETDAIARAQENPLYSSEDSVHIVQKQPLTIDASSKPVVKSDYLINATDADLQPRSLPKDTAIFTTNDQNVEFSHNYRSQNRASSSSSVEQREAFQLSNKERLHLRKQALKLRKIPVFSVGKSNVFTGLAKELKAHLKKHPIAIVNIKGRAKGTSAHEVIYNLKVPALFLLFPLKRNKTQATGAVLVSQEPSKVILYRGWGLTTEPNQASRKGTKDFKNESMGQEVKAHGPISRELLSAMRLECGLKSADDETDGIVDNIPYDTANT